MVKPCYRVIFGSAGDFRYGNGKLGELRDFNKDSAMVQDKSTTRSVTRGRLNLLKG